MKLLLRLVNYIGMAYVKFRCHREYSNQSYTGLNERPIELAFLFRHIIALTPRKILDVGTGITALPQVLRACGYLVTAIDNVKDYWPAGMVNRHYHVLNEDILNPRTSETFDLITCISVLEHIPNHQRAIVSMCKLLNKGGYLILTCPYTEDSYVDNVYQLPDSEVIHQQPTFLTQSFSRVELNGWLDSTRFEIIDQEYWNFYTGSHWTCGKKHTPPLISNAHQAHQLSCLLLRKN